MPAELRRTEGAGHKIHVHGCIYKVPGSVATGNRRLQGGQGGGRGMRDENAAACGRAIGGSETERGYAGHSRSQVATSCFPVINLSMRRGV